MSDMVGIVAGYRQQEIETRVFAALECDAVSLDVCSKLGPKVFTVSMPRWVSPFTVSPDMEDLWAATESVFQARQLAAVAVEFDNTVPEPETPSRWPTRQGMRLTLLAAVLAVLLSPVLYLGVWPLAAVWVACVQLWVVAVSKHVRRDVPRFRFTSAASLKREERKVACRHSNWCHQRLPHDSRYPFYDAHGLLNNEDGENVGAQASCKHGTRWVKHKSNIGWVFWQRIEGGQA